MDIASRDKGFALKLRAIAFDDTLSVRYNRKDIAAIMEISLPTLRKKLKAIEKMYQDGFVAEFFPVCEKCYLSEENIEAVKDILKDETNGRLYKQVSWFLTNGFHLRKDADNRLNEVFSGVLGRKQPVVKKGERAVFDW